MFIGLDQLWSADSRWRPVVRSSPHFVIEAFVRDPRPGRGSGPYGVPDAQLLDLYLEALEKAHDRLVAPPFSRVPLPTDEGQKVRVYAVHRGEISADGASEAMTYWDFRRGAPSIKLQCRRVETGVSVAREAAAVEAVHEATHVFAFMLRRGYIFDWEWFADAEAVFMERLVLQGIQTHLIYARDWLDYPNASLDHPDLGYSANVFMRYLALRFDAGIASRIWQQATPGETPVQAMARLLLLAGGPPFADADPGVQDLFASGYCRNSYIPDFADDIRGGFGLRAVTETFEIGPQGKAEATDTIDHLACRYYRISVHEVDALQVTVGPLPAGARIKAELGEVLRSAVGSLVLGDVVPLRPVVDAPGSLSARWDLGGTRPDHLVLIVTNCGLDDRADGVVFMLGVTAQ